jgi:hypothetical protein
MLMPAAVLVMIILASIGGDLSYIHMARVRLSDLAQTMANDIATGALDTSALRNSGQYEIVDAKASAIADRVLRSSGTNAFRSRPNVDVERFTAADGSMRVRVTLSTDVDHIFGKAIPGAGDPMPLVATSVARLKDQQ